MKSIFVLPGGGANGAFQAGALYYAMTQTSFKPTGGILGISVGSLNGFLVAQWRPEAMREIWSRIKTKDVLRKRNIASLGFQTAVSRLFGKKAPRGFYDWSPLWSMIKAEGQKAPLVYKLRVGTTSLEIGGNPYKEWELGPGYVNEEQLKAVFASAVQPILGDPTDLKDHPAAVDGGVWQINPISSTLNLDPEHVFIFDTGPHEVDAGHKSTWIGDDAKRVLEILLTRQVQQDFRFVRTINRLVLQAQTVGLTLSKEDGSPYRWFGITLIQPPASKWDSLDFDNGIMERWKSGYETAREVFDSWTIMGVPR